MNPHASARISPTLQDVVAAAVGGPVPVEVAGDEEATAPTVAVAPRSMLRASILFPFLKPKNHRVIILKSPIR